ncbi:MocR-like pyridoxine biosynthesis transcription factor PdxR [Niallia nealsonii]|uniref:GntR family transcriptional regulator n=1 Tax=Niallia nealsonii TaxID=115979 RepID=A0A2N0Z6J3_9BACI|nr:PLP-dependent aminotransferase family protein [Niallia nealsonii]PKG25107.1 GntR family transcriptional regulator [Niallia nealsonii]
MIFTTVDRKSSKSLTQQVYEQIRNGILDGKLKEGQKLLSSRELAKIINVSRNVVLEAYHRLLAEGYIEVKPRSGTFIAKGTSLEHIGAKKLDIEKKQKEELEDSIIDFRGGNPAIDHFPRKKWGDLTKKICNESPQSIFGYSSACGIQELRDVLVSYLRRARGVHCQPEQIIITSGATQGLKLITELLITDKKRDYIAVEDPVTDEMRNIFTYAKAEIYPVSVDENGIIPELLPKEKPNFVFVIPSHQYPLGGILSIQRRLKLIEYARRMNCYIVEDDYDSEFTYEGAPVPAMQGIDQERVLYVGTFSKILSPALRIGYVVLPAHLVGEFQKLKWFTDRHTSTLEQHTLARFIEGGYLDKHIRKMRKIYQERRLVLVNSIQKYFHQAKIIGKAAGMHLVVEMAGIDFKKELVQKIKEKGVCIYPVEEYSIKKGEHTQKIIMGYGGLTPEQIKKGILLLRDALNEYKG